MARTKPCLFLLSAVVLGASLSLFAQDNQSAPSSHVKEVPAPVEIDDAAGGRVKEVPAPVFSNPFDSDSPKDNSIRPIEIIPAGEMTREDQDLLANAESAIQERAGVENFEFDGPGWTHYQLVCPALPNHLFVRFTRDDGTRQMSMFSASIPRDGNGRMHIIPIIRRGYSLFSPAPIGALTIAAFNRIRAEEDAGAKTDWLGTGLCYAALAGANPKVGGLAPAASNDISAVMPPTLNIMNGGGAIIRFIDISVPSRPMEWSMTFDPRGKLLKAAHSRASVENPGKPVPSSVDFGQAKQ